MEEEKFQKSLFELDQPKKSFSRLSDMLPRADFDGKIMLTISLDKLIFITIGIIMIMVVLYALGVESGISTVKESGSKSLKQVELHVMPPVLQQRAATIPAKSILSTAPVTSSVKPIAKPRPIVSGASKVKIVPQAPKPYTILVGSFTKIENARTAGAILVKQGFTVTISYRAPYYMVSAGAYSDKSQADLLRDLASIRRLFRDATIKIK